MLLTSFGQTLPNATTITYPSSTWNPRNSSKGLSVFLDCGTPSTLLPNSVMFAVGQDYPDAELKMDKDGAPFYKIPCNAPQGTFDFTFGTTGIKVSYQDMIYHEADGTCSLGFSVGPQDDGIIPYILANNFMRGAYIVFDLQNEALWLGESDDCGSQIIAIGQENGDVPRVPGCNCKTKSTSTGISPSQVPTPPPYATPSSA